MVLVYLTRKLIIDTFPATLTVFLAVFLTGLAPTGFDIRVSGKDIAEALLDRCGASCNEPGKEDDDGGGELRC